MKKLAVIKIGTSLVTKKDGSLNNSFLKRICEEIAEIKRSGHSIILVSSGAMASGVGVLNDTPHDIVERALFSCVGQPVLMDHYRNLFTSENIIVAQALLTWNDIDEENARALVKENIGKLIEGGIVPIVNENDLTATEELSFGDNDQLAAKVAVLFEAERLVILSDVDGLYDKNPQQYKDAKQFDVVKRVTLDIENCAGDKISKNSLGGMASKISATKYATENGVETIIVSDVDGRNTLVSVILEGALIGTKFLARVS